MNWNKIASLLNVIHLASSAGPKFNKFAAQAAIELEQEWGVPPQEEEAPAEDVAPADDEPTNGNALRRL
jgi:hypothetical protein